MLDLKHVISTYPIALTSKEQFSGILKDLYPGRANVIRIKVLTDLFSIGILDDIKNNTINELSLLSYVNSLEANYGYAKELIYGAIYLWIEAYADSHPQLSALMTKIPNTMSFMDNPSFGDDGDSEGEVKKINWNASQLGGTKQSIKMLDASQKRIVGLFDECKYRAMIAYYEENRPVTPFDFVMMAYGYLFTGEYENAITVCDELDSSTNSVASFSEPVLDSYLHARTTAKKINVLIADISNAIELIRNFAISAKEISEFALLVQDHNTNGKGVVSIQPEDISGYFAKICKERNEIPSPMLMIDGIRQWIYKDNQNGDEKLAYATAEYFFAQKEYSAASYCYYYAFTINCVNPKYYAYFGQCMLRGNRIIDGGLMAGHEALKIAISLDPDNVTWRIMHATLLTHIQTCTPFNVKKIRSLAVRLADSCTNKTAEDIVSIERLQSIEWNEGI